MAPPLMNASPNISNGYFVYVFVNAFLTGAVSVLLVVFAATVLLATSADWNHPSAWNLLAISPLLMFACP